MALGFKVVLLAAAGVCLCSAADATVIVSTFSGTVTGTDSDGLFGAAYSSLNTSFVATYTYDTANGATFANPSYIQGVGTGTITINGHSYTLTGSGGNIYRNSNNGEEAQGYVASGGNFFYTRLSSATDTIYNSTDLTTAFNYTAQNANEVGAFDVGNDYLTLTPTQGSGGVQAAAASVPEPATWALMIGGFGMIGAAMRRSRRTSILFS